MKNKEKLCWYALLLSKYVMVVLVAVLLVSVGVRIGYSMAREWYSDRLDEYEDKRRVVLSVVERFGAPDPAEVQLNEDAEALARVLYGVRDNDTDDLRTYCWCVFNRVDNPAFPNSIQDVIDQPNQWMRYDSSNPILDSLYEIAREEISAWRSGGHRPVSNAYVFMSWTSNDICLRNEYKETATTRYWRYGQ